MLDAPLYIHLPKLILWALFEGNLFVIVGETYRVRDPTTTGTQHTDMQPGLAVSCLPLA